MNNSALEFHDSTVQSIEVFADTVIVRFSSAYIHRSPGRPGIDPGQGFAQAVELTLHEASVLDRSGDCLGRLSDGSLRVDGIAGNLAPLPMDVIASIGLELAFADGSRFAVACARATLQAAGDARFIENTAF